MIDFISIFSARFRTISLLSSLSPAYKSNHCTSLANWPVRPAQLPNNLARSRFFKLSLSKSRSRFRHVLFIMTFYSRKKENISFRLVATALRLSGIVYSLLCHSMTGAYSRCRNSQPIHLFAFCNQHQVNAPPGCSHSRLYLFRKHLVC